MEFEMTDIELESKPPKAFGVECQLDPRIHKERATYLERNTLYRLGRSLINELRDGAPRTVQLSRTEETQYVSDFVLMTKFATKRIIRYRLQLDAARVINPRAVAVVFQAQQPAPKTMLKRFGEWFDRMAQPVEYDGPYGNPESV